MRLQRAARAFAIAALPQTFLLATATASGEPAQSQKEAWPSSVEARYRLQYNGFDVGHLHIKSTADGNTYSLSGSGKVSAFFGLVTWSGSSTVSGAIERGEPSPGNYSFDWQHNKKGGHIRLGFKDRVATHVTVIPPASPKPDVVPLAEPHKAGVLDPVSAVMLLTRSDQRPPCDRRVGVFDGKQRYDIVLTPKRTTALPSASGHGPGDTGHVCRVTYVPVAGHRDNDATRAYAANRDSEVVMRHVAGTRAIIPYAITVPTAWGTGAMVTERIDILTPNNGRVALTR